MSSNKNRAKMGENMINIDENSICFVCTLGLVFCCIVLNIANYDLFRLLGFNRFSI